MKKILITSILGLILIASFFNIGTEKVLALIDVGEAPEPTECCQLKESVTIGGETYPAGSIVAPALDAACYIGTVEETPDEATAHWAGICFVNSIRTICDWIFWIAFILTGIVLIFAGITFLTAAGNPERVSKAKAIFLYSLIGILVIALAGWIPAIVLYFLGF